LSPNEASPLGQVCYKVQLASADAVTLNLAGQNYRLYYDAKRLNFNEEDSRVLLPESKYSQLVIKDNVKGIDAGGAGPLAFDSDLGFINLGNDLVDELNGGIELPASGEWLTTANVCFDIMKEENQAASESDFGFYWARKELTQSYATAYVEVAEWTGPNKVVPAKAAIYFDQELSTSNNEQLWDHVPSVYPIPTRDELTINYKGKESLLVQVYSTNGQLLLKDNYPANVDNYQIKLGNLATGFYQLRLSNKEKVLIKKIERVQ
jgi:hypothetical protein